MDEFLSNIYNYILLIINGSTIFGPLFACLLIFLESILPVLPLFVFITILFVSFGYGIGFIISYILTCLGCFFSYYLCKNFLKGFFEKKVRKITTFDKLMSKFDKITLSELTLLVSLPFTPAFLINITSALSNLSFKKFFVSIVIGKLFLVFFWGFIGTSLIESLKNPKILLIICLMLLVSYILSKLVSKNMKIE